MAALSGSELEAAALEWLENLGWRVAHDSDIAPGTAGAGRTDYRDVILARQLRAALATLNPGLPAEALDDAFRRLTHPEGQRWSPAIAPSKR